MKSFSDAEMSQIKLYLTKAKVLVIDDELGGRLALKNGLISFNIPSHHIRTANSLTHAKIELERDTPHIVLSEHLLEDGFGYDLFREKSNIIFILVTEENSKSVLAHAAENGVDYFLFKPYERDNLREVLYQSILKKVLPTPLSLCFDIGKIKSRMGLASQALDLFLEAKQLNPSLAEIYALIGSTLEELGRPALEIESVYAEGLARAPHHFKCLWGLYRSYGQRNETAKSYHALKKLILNFPENPERIVDAITLALKSKNFQDIEIYCEIFSRMHCKNIVLEKTLASALSALGTLSIQQKERPVAIRYFRKALEITSNKAKFVEYMCSQLKIAGFSNDADDLLHLVNGLEKTPSTVPRAS